MLERHAIGESAPAQAPAHWTVRWAARWVARRGSSRADGARVGTKERNIPFTGLIVPVCLIAVWEWLCRIGVFAPWQLPAPSYVLGTVAELFSSGELYVHSWASIRRVLTGFGIGGGLGALVGYSVGISRTFEKLVDTTLQAIKSVPSLGWVPLLILWFGIEETPKLALIAIGSFFPVYVNIVSGVRGVDTKLIEVGRVFCLSRGALLRRIVLPASAPAVFTGLRVGLTQAWLFMVIAELMGASEGLGFLLTTGREVARPDLLLGSLVILAVFGKISDGIVKLVEGALLSWRESYHG